MTREEIDDTIKDILHRDGPDGHIDGHHIITSFIIALMNGKEEEWVDNYDKED